MPWCSTFGLRWTTELGVIGGEPTLKFPMNLVQIVRNEFSFWGAHRTVGFLLEISHQDADLYHLAYRRTACSLCRSHWRTTQSTSIILNPLQLKVNLERICCIPCTLPIPYCNRYVPFLHFRIISGEKSPQLRLLGFRTDLLRARGSRHFHPFPAGNYAPLPRMPIDDPKRWLLLHRVY